MSDGTVNVKSQPLRAFVSVMVRPRETIRTILDELPDDYALFLIVLATFSEIIVDEDWGRISKPLRSLSIDSAGMIVLVTAVAITLVTVAVFYGFSHLVAWVGWFLGGRGNAEAMRSALAWGSVPYVWALLFRVPARLIWSEQLVSVVSPRGGSPSIIESMRTGALPDAVLVPVVIFAMLEATAGIWYLVLMTKCVGEAHSFSAWRGLASLVISVILPLIAVAIVIAVSVIIISIASS